MIHPNIEYRTQIKLNFNTDHAIETVILSNRKYNHYMSDTVMKSIFFDNFRLLILKLKTHQIKNPTEMNNKKNIKIIYQISSFPVQQQQDF